MDHSVLTFVHVDQVGQSKNAKDQSSIRRAAMKTFRRRERLARVKEYQAACATKGNAKESSTTFGSPLIASDAPDLAKTESLSIPTGAAIESWLNLEDGAWPECQSTSDIEYPLPSADKYSVVTTSIPHGIPRDLGYQNLHPGENATGLAYLFNYFISVILPIMLPVGSQSGQKALRTHWSRNLVRDPLILQVAVSHAAVHMDVVYQRKPSSLAAMHTKQAIRLINERIAAKPPEIDTEVIGAVALVASNSNVTGDLAESQIHMNALKKMITLKGGRDSHSLASSESVQTILSWADTTSARIARSRPRFALEPSRTTGQTESEHSSGGTTKFYKEEMFRLLDQLRKLAALKGIIDRESSATIADILAFDAHRNKLEERLLCLQHTLSTTPNLEFGDQFLETFSIATSIYASLAFRNFRLDFPILRTLKQDLMTAIVKTEALYVSLSVMPDSDVPYAESLLWSLFIGGVLSLDESERSWFANRISLVAPWAQVTSWEDAEVCLRRILWVDKLHHTACICLWNEVEELLGLNIGKT